MRLGFLGKPLGRPELKSHDTRRWQNSPHLSVSLAHLRDVFAYLHSMRIGMYRMSAELAPYATHPSLPQFHDQVAQCKDELLQAGAERRDLRLSTHPGQHIVLNSPADDLAARSAADLTVQAAILDGMQLGPEAVIVTHIGGVYNDREKALERFVRRFEGLPPDVRRRIAIENDDTRFSVVDACWVSDRTGIPVVFDYLHHRLHDPNRQPAREALASCLATWPKDVTPKIHFSSPRTEWRVEERGAELPPLLHRARWSYHSDYVNPFEFIDFLRAVEGLPTFDVMLEVRAKDLALMQLREDLRRFAPGLPASSEEPG